MTDQEIMWLLMILLPIVGFMLGAAWNQAEHDVKSEEEGGTKQKKKAAS